MFNYLLVIIAGYSFGNRPQSYFGAFIIAILTGIIKLPLEQQQIVPKVPYSDVAQKAATQFDVDVALVLAVIKAESNFNSKAVSPKGAVGLMQLMPATAKRYGVTDSTNATQNIYGGTRYLKYLLSMFHDIHLAVAAYNAGEGAVIRYGGKIPPYQETQAYVKRVLAYYQEFGGRHV